MAAWVDGDVVGERVCWLCRCGLFGLFCGCFALLWAFVLICVWFGWLGCCYCAFVLGLVVCLLIVLSAIRLLMIEFTVC